MPAFCGRDYSLLMLLIGVSATVFGMVVLRPVINQMILGHHLARLTSLVEEMEQNRLIGVSLDQTPFRQRFLMGRQWEAGVTVFRRYPPFVITRELLKNALICKSVGRHLREQSIYILIDKLSQEGVAEHRDDFAREAFLAQHGQ